MTKKQAYKYHRYLLSVWIILCLMIALPRSDTPHLLTSNPSQLNNSKNIPRSDTCYRIFTLPRGFAIQQRGRDGSSHARSPTPWMTPGEYLALGHDLRNLLQKKHSNGNTNEGKQSNPEADFDPLLNEYPLIPCSLRRYNAVTLNRCFLKRLEEKPTLQIFFMGDSKIRSIFFAFLNATRGMKYNVTFMVSSYRLYKFC